jgi:hypothetical protein
LEYIFFGGGAIRFGGFKNYLKNEKMNKVYSKTELQEKAQEVFDQYPSEDKIFAREDGNIFLNESYAELDRGNLKVYPFDRSDIVKTDKKVEAPKVDKTLGKDGKNPETRNSNTNK